MTDIKIDRVTSMKFIDTEGRVYAVILNEEKNQQKLYGIITVNDGYTNFDGKDLVFDDNDGVWEIEYETD